VCPVGGRRLVVATDCKTMVFSSKGRLIFTFRSSLPGGSRQSSGFKNTVLECIFNEAKKTFYVVDTMCWNGTYYYDASSEFRLAWKMMKFNDNPQFSTPIKDNSYAFVSLPAIGCSRTAIDAQLAKWPTVEVDGLLFYNKEAPYVLGTTPLVSWLKPNMIDGLFATPVPEMMMEETSEAL